MVAKLVGFKNFDKGMKYSIIVGKYLKNFRKIFNKTCYRV